ncbi:GvpL/GvpF family gas vesicle protein [Actinomadura sp. WMMB 499]|uniref:GvpL/GvpF family gas vesicle protein n=1 Tax=Actinomadura sp. WMMB 499 TaxID=1219491 RepID=UPI0012448843|nr:GvpL/GvpF family gas vesicle protein [Actinomadura sp. WMMB 499]QFG25195.1 GvpL/GvpF family gas vesicle protein [Actinomadura sp. WMMB 499]
MTVAPTPATPPVARDELSYVYAVGPRGPELARAAPELTGLQDRPVHTVEAGGLAAVVSRVPEAQFGEEGFKAQLEDLGRLEVIARTHHGVVDALFRAVTVLPLRLATVYRDDERVAAMLEESRTEFGGLLDRLAGHLECGVKVYALPPDPRNAPSAPARTGGAGGERGAAGSNPGRDYLRRRKAQRTRHEDSAREAAETAARVREVAAAHAVDRVAHRPQQGELATGEGRNITNEAYLVPAGTTGAFAEAVRAAARDLPGVRVEVTGPWAPYSFATPPPVEDGGRRGR